MKFNEGSEATILDAFDACLSRGNLSIRSDDPVSLALWIGCSKLLKDWADTRRPKTPETNLAHSWYAVTTMTAQLEREGENDERGKG